MSAKRPKVQIILTGITGRERIGYSAHKLSHFLPSFAFSKAEQYEFICSRFRPTLTSDIITKTVRSFFVEKTGYLAGISTSTKAVSLQREAGKFEFSWYLYTKWAAAAACLFFRPAMFSFLCFSGTKKGRL